MNDWEEISPTIELAINLLPEQSTWFTSFYLHYGHERILPFQLLRGDEIDETENVMFFVRRVTVDWELVKDNLQGAGKFRKNIIIKKHKYVQFVVGDVELLCTWNSKMKVIQEKGKETFCEIF